MSGQSSHDRFECMDILRKLESADINEFNYAVGFITGLHHSVEKECRKKKNSLKVIENKKVLTLPSPG